jgi:membrane protease subunit (stomatin/prohibitin family)
MGIGDFIKKQFIDVLQWQEDGDGTLAWRHPMQDAEIQYGAQLTVRESQAALFVNEGRIADVLGPGRHVLKTSTLPVLTYLQNWDKLFESPFKSDVYFFSTRLQLGRKWGTAQPVTVRDKDFGMVRLRAFGVYSYRLADPKQFFAEISGTRDIYTVDDLEMQLRNLIVSAMSNTLGASELPFLDMATNFGMLGERMKEAMAPVFERYGVALDNFAVESVSLPEELQKAFDTRVSMGMAGNLAAFTQYQTATAIPMAAQNEGGLAGIGASLGAGLSMGQVMTEAMRGSVLPAATTPPASAPAAADTPEAKLGKLKSLLDGGLITEADYTAAKAELLKRITG